MSGVEPNPGLAGAAEPALTVAAVARRLGIAPATLRTWDRRYGLGPSDHASGRHRRYHSDDVARLEQMQRALLRGASPAEAARYALTAGPDATTPTDPVARLPRPPAKAERASPTLPAKAERAAPTPPAKAERVDPALPAKAERVDPALPAKAQRANPALPAKAQRVDPTPPAKAQRAKSTLPGAGRYARGFARAVLAMDSAAAQQLLGDAIAVGGVPHAWDEVVRPVLAAVTHTPGAAIEAEHLLYECVLAALIRATPLVTEPCNPRPVLLAGAPGEQHTLPLYGLAATLAERGVGTRMLGPALPLDALAAAIRRLAPAVVVVWAHLPAQAEPARIRHRRTRLFLGGPGWYGGTPDLALADGMESAADEIVGVVR